MCGDSPPPAYTGPGDAHSNQEWIWQRERYKSMFADASGEMLCGESTPFYLYNRDARRRIAADIPHAKLIAVLRDPVDRLYSNWMHLRAEGLEPCADVLEACARESHRIDEGWAPFWHYRNVGMYGRQLADLFRQFPAEQVLLLRYRDLIDSPVQTLDPQLVGRPQRDRCRRDGMARLPQQATGRRGPRRLGDGSSILRWCLL